MKAKVEAIRLRAGLLMNLGDVTDRSGPKMMLVAAPATGAMAVRMLIPHRVHASIGVLGAVSVATACLVPGSPAAAVATVAKDRRLVPGVEHARGVTECVVTLDEEGRPVEAGMLRTARKLMDGEVFGRRARTTAAAAGRSTPLRRATSPRRARGMRIATCSGRRRSSRSAPAPGTCRRTPAPTRCSRFAGIWGSPATWSCRRAGRYLARLEEPPLDSYR